MPPNRRPHPPHLRPRNLRKQRIPLPRQLHLSFQFPKPHDRYTGELQPGFQSRGRDGEDDVGAGEGDANQTIYGGGKIAMECVESDRGIWGKGTACFYRDGPTALQMTGYIEPAVKA
ncbi:MAG: hypothetical protein LQ337_005122 [Flavoplaca oasis]|nr:MAG: hypothetical protein LQ337_005122 [Flavoplaca oasis]